MYLQHEVGIFVLFLVDRDNIGEVLAVLTLESDVDIDFDSLQGLIQTCL